MDEPSMSRALAAAEFAGAGRLEEDAAPARLARLAALPWRSYARCLLLTAIVGAAGFLAYRPALLRLSILMSLVSPSRGETLVLQWERAEEDPLRLAPVRFTPPPDEWRPAGARAAGWTALRPAAPADAWQGGALDAFTWRRESFNPWAWADDAARKPRRAEAPEEAPGQKAESSVRIAVVPAAASSEPSPSSAPEEKAETAFPEAKPAAKESPLLPLELPPALPSALPEGSGNAAGQENPAFALPSLPSLSQPMPDLRLPPLPSAQPAESAPATQPERLVSEPLPLPGVPVLGIPSVADKPAEAAAPAPTPQEEAEPPRAISPSEALSAAFAVAPSTLEPEAASETSGASDPVDWKEREITGPIPGAYLTIYPKLNFIGLCVPGQGYIRKYNQVAVPMDLDQPKQHAADGRTPYGKYYVAGHLRDAAGPRLELSWPSVEDARRAGAVPEMLAEIDRAWSGQAMPPQDTVAGGGLSLTGDRNSVEYTSGGFSLEAPHLEEIFTALPDGAWVFVQQ